MGRGYAIGCMCVCPSVYLCITRIMETTTPIHIKFSGSMYHGKGQGDYMVYQKNGFPQNKFPCLMWFGNDGCIRDRSSTMLMVHYWVTTVICHRKEEWTQQEWTMYSKARSTPFRKPTQSGLSIMNVFFMFRTMVHMYESKLNSTSVRLCLKRMTVITQKSYVPSVKRQKRKDTVHPFIKMKGNVRNNRTLQLLLRLLD